MSALSFFDTGEEDRRAARRPVASVKLARPAAASERAFAAAGRGNGHAVGRPNGHGGPVGGGRTAAKGGVSLRLNDKNDELDAEFERY